MSKADLEFNKIKVVPTELVVNLGITPDNLHHLQQQDHFCKRIWKEFQTAMVQSTNPYFIKDNFLIRNVLGNKQTF